MSNEFKELINNINLSKAEIARRCDVSKQTIFVYLRKEHITFYNLTLLEKLKKLAAEFPR
jgi:transcriptional regulator with XRE-family HTH domain